MLVHGQALICTSQSKAQAFQDGGCFILHRAPLLFLFEQHDLNELDENEAQHVVVRTRAARGLHRRAVVTLNESSCTLLD